MMLMMTGTTDCIRLDCDDTTDVVSPSATEVWYDGVDQNCDGLSDFDQDGDGAISDQYGGTDCNDTDATAYVGNIEIWYNGVDNNCDGLSDFDADGDGYDSSVYGGLDCTDNNALINPDAIEIFYDGFDYDCSGTSDYDADGDGYDSSTYGGTDCDDGDPNTSPAKQKFGTTVTTRIATAGLTLMQIWMGLTEISLGDWIVMIPIRLPIQT